MAIPPPIDVTSHVSIFFSSTQSSRPDDSLVRPDENKPNSRLQGLTVAPSIEATLENFHYFTKRATEFQLLVGSVAGCMVCIDYWRTSKCHPRVGGVGTAWFMTMLSHSHTQTYRAPYITPELSDLRRSHQSYVLTGIPPLI